MRTCLVVLSNVILVFCSGAASSSEQAGPMPNRFLFTCLGWPTAQPDQDYYPAEIPDSLVGDWKDYAAYLKEQGFTTIAPWGFLCNTLPYPLGIDTKSTGTKTIRVSGDHVAKARDIIKRCQGNGLEFYYGMCLYFAYYGDYLAVSGAATDPERKSVPCPLYPGDSHKGVEASPETQILFYQRPWQSTPPTHVARDAWFMPNLVHPLGKDIHRRAEIVPWAGAMVCTLPKENPGDNISLRFAARMMNQAHRDPVVVAKGILRERYAPKTQEALDELFLVFDHAERAFRERWPSWFMHIDMVPAKLGALDSRQAWSPEKAVGYVNALQQSLARLRAVKADLGQRSEAERLEASIVNWIEFNKDQMRQGYDYDMP